MLGSVPEDKARRDGDVDERGVPSAEGDVPCDTTLETEAGGVVRFGGQLLTIRLRRQTVISENLRRAALYSPGFQIILLEYAMVYSSWVSSYLIGQVFAEALTPLALVANIPTRLPIDI
jgi:hypothetical protein